jgi:hypothetical protein
MQKTLNLLEFEKLSDTETFVADNAILDPERPDGLFEPLANRGLWKRWSAKLGHGTPPAS